MRRQNLDHLLTVFTRRHAAGQLSSDRLLAAIVASSDDAIISKSLDGIVRSWNAAAERLFGHTSEQAVGRHISLIIPHDRIAEEDEIIASLKAGRRIDHYETERLRADGRRIRVSLTISPIHDDGGAVVGASKIVRDVTRQREAEERAEAERRRLEDDLRRVAADLSEADRRKNEFLALLAHELRNPLAPISNAVQALRLGGRDGEVVRAASTMLERQVRQMVRLVDDLLDMSRITRGRIELRNERVELAAIVHQAVEATRAHYASMGHELTVKVAPEPIVLHADPARLTQVVGNLLNNACKFTERGGHVGLTAEREGAHAVLRVRDDGIGIAAGELGRLFDMFTQADTSLERSRGGLGIGLTLVKTLVEMQGGSIEAHSEGLGRGSEFVVRLPIPAVPPAPPPEAPAEPAPGPRQRILIVDDNEDAAEWLGALLRLGGHETHLARDGVEALEATHRLSPEVVLLDIGLPRLNGYEVCRRLRQQPWGRGLAIVALTGWGQEEDRQRSREAGFDAHLVKPVDEAVIARLLANLPPR